jgi:carbamate kinase
VLVVIALGGNALLKRGEPLEAEVQKRNVEVAAAAVAEIARAHAVVVTHGNGPQVGLLALQAQAFEAVAPYPLDVLGAESEGMIGYLIEQELINRLPERHVVTLLTQVTVDPRDPALQAPTKPIGPIYGADEARRLAQERGWTVAPEAGGFRRAVPSPEPLRIIELAAIRLLVEAGVMVVCAGGGGIPVVVTPAGGIKGVEAVIDKDLSAALLAAELGADALLMLTDVEAVWSDWKTPRARRIREAAPDQLRALSFEAGSMGPKVEAAARFVERTGRFAGIGWLSEAPLILERKAGTIVRPGLQAMAWYEGAQAGGA